MPNRLALETSPYLLQHSDNPVDWHPCGEQALTSVKSKLLSARERRTRPGRDNKILVGWHALMIKGLARAGRVFGRSDWVGLGLTGLDFIRARLWPSGKLRASSQNGQAKLNAYLDDYAFLLDALLELLQSDFRLKDLEFAQSLADGLVQDFEDREKGGFFSPAMIMSV